MRMKPSRPPEVVLRRVVRLARLNGWSVALFAGLCALISLAFLDPLGVEVSLLVALGGALEVHGQRMLTRRQADGVRWLVRGQIVVLAVIWAYAARQLLSFDPVYLRDEVIPNAREWLSALGINFDQIFEQADMDKEAVVAFVRLMLVVVYGSVALVTLIYQGGLALYYRGCAAAVATALQAPPVVPAAPPIASPDDFAI